MNLNKKTINAIKKAKELLALIDETKDARERANTVYQRAANIMLSAPKRYPIQEWELVATLLRKQYAMERKLKQVQETILTSLGAGKFDKPFSLI